MTEDLNPMARRLAILAAVLATGFLAVAAASAHYGHRSTVVNAPIIIYLFTACAVSLAGRQDAKRGTAAPSEGAVLLISIPWSLALESIVALPSALVPAFIRAYGGFAGTVMSAVAVIFVITGLTLFARNLKRRFAPQWNRPTRAEMLEDVRAEVLRWNLAPGDAARRNSLIERIGPYAAPAKPAAAPKDASA